HGLEGTHNRLRHGGAFAWRASVHTLAEAVEIGLRTRVTMAVFDDNYTEVLELMETVEAAGASCFSLLIGSPVGRGLTMLDRVVAPESWRRLQDAIRART